MCAPYIYIQICHLSRAGTEHHHLTPPIIPHAIGAATEESFVYKCSVRTQHSSHRISEDPVHRQYQELNPSLEKTESPFDALTTATTTDAYDDTVICKMAEHHKYLLLYFYMCYKLSVTNVLLFLTCNSVTNTLLCAQRVIHIINKAAVHTCTYVRKTVGYLPYSLVGLHQPSPRKFSWFSSILKQMFRWFPRSLLLMRALHAALLTWIHQN
jgi:hypothetical protein